MGMLVLRTGAEGRKLVTYIQEQAKLCGDYEKLFSLHT
jgi:hypothetical protein